MDELILCDVEDAIATVTINRPEKRNALNRATWIRLGETVEALSADDDLRCVVIRGAGSIAFAAGADISGFEAERSSATLVRDYTDAESRALDALTDSRHPVVAMIHGFCLGGGFELACACDLRIADTASKFGLPTRNMGLYLGYHLLEPVVPVTGRAIALEMTLEGRVYDAEEALQKGLVNRVVPADALPGEAMATARRIAEGAPLAARWHRRAIRRVADPAPLTEAEIEESFGYADSEDYYTGYRAFLAKQKPRFEGR